MVNTTIQQATIAPVTTSPTPTPTKKPVATMKKTTMKKTAKKVVSEPKKRGVKPGFVRAKAPLANATDLPLLTIANGESPGSKWWVGEMKDRSGGGICKCWHLFRLDKVNDLSKVNLSSPKNTSSNEPQVILLTDLDLGKIALSKLQETRIKYQLENPALEFPTLEQDREWVMQCRAKGTLPSSEVRRLKDRKKRAEGAVKKSNEKKVVHRRKINAASRNAAVELLEAQLKAKIEERVVSSPQVSPIVQEVSQVASTVE